MYHILFYSIDATHSHSLGKFVNDSCHGNSVMQKIVVEKQPKLCIFALRDIENGEEITYNYGASGLWWRKVSYFSIIIYF